MAECGRIQNNAQAKLEAMTNGCQEEHVQKMTGGPAIFGIPTPDIGGLLLAMRTCEAKMASVETSSDNLRCPR